MSRRTLAPQSSLKGLPRRKGRRANAFVNHSVLARWLSAPESSPKPPASPSAIADEEIEGEQDDDPGKQPSRALAFLAPRTA